MTGLLDLPPEVLHNIYDWLRLIELAAFACGWKRTDPFPFTWQFNSRALQPYTEGYRHHRRSFAALDQLVAFSRLVQRSPRIGSYVRELHLGDVLASGGAPAEAGQRAALAALWPAMAGIRVVKLENMPDVVGSLLGAVERGLRLTCLEELAIESGFGGSARAWDLGVWRTVLAATPALRKLSIDLQATFVNIMNEGAHEPPALDAAPATPLASGVTSLELTGFPASHAPAGAALANAFPQLTALGLSANTQIEQPKILLGLRLPTLRSLSYQWLVENELRCEPLAALDVRHLPALEEVAIASAICAPSFGFRLPPSVTSLICEVWNTVPLRALVDLIEPGPAHHPGLRHIKLDLAFGDPYPFPVGHSEDEMAERKLEERYDDLPRWTEEVSRAGLMRLLRMAERYGVEVTGTATAAFDFEKAVLRRVNAGHESIAWDQDDLDDIYMYWDEEGYMDDEIDSEDDEEEGGEW